VIAQASEYDLRYARSPLTLVNWADATRVGGVPPPALFGTAESFTVPGLTPLVNYYFAIRAADDRGHWSALSNVVQESISIAELTRLTFSASPPGAADPSWSPNGDWIVYGLNLAGAPPVIYRVSPSGGPSERFPGIADDCYKPAWSPDGKRLAFVYLDDDSQRLMVMSVEPPGPATSLVSYSAGSMTVIISPSWSPDGARIAYAVAAAPWRSWENYTVSTSGGLARLLLGAEYGAVAVAWSPDGTSIAYGTSQPPYGIRVMPASGGQPVSLTTGTYDGGPIWSPDGTRIAYTSTRDGNSDIWVMDAGGEHQTRLTNSPMLEHSPSWSPDGRALAIIRSDGPLTVADIWILPVDEP
jgi:Tol biopolymer transport system component